MVKICLLGKDILPNTLLISTYFTSFRGLCTSQIYFLLSKHLYSLCIFKQNIHILRICCNQALWLMEKICCSLASIKEGEDSKLKTFCTLRSLIVALNPWFHVYLWLHNSKKLWRKTLLLGTHTFISPYTPIRDPRVAWILFWIILVA